MISRGMVSAVAMVVCAPICAWGCGSTSKLEKADRSWVHSDTPLYGFEGHGRFFKVIPGSNKTETIVEHQFSYEPEVRLSPDGRYVLYYGQAHGSDSPFYLYDRKQGAERTLPDLKKRSVVPAFSPNSDFILLWSEDRSQDLYLFNLASSKVTAIPFPEDANKQSYFGGFWGPDGKSVYVISMMGKDSDQHYFRYDITSGAYTKVSGRPTNNGNIAVFMEQGHDVPTVDMFGPCTAKESRCSHDKAQSPDGALLALVDDKHRLMIEAAGEQRLVDGGGYDQCEGDYIHLNGWLDNNYLIYHVRGIPYIYDVRTGKKSVLFDRDKVSEFFW